MEEILRGGGAGDVVRDATIQRFEYSFETIVKAAQRYLAVKEGREIAGPKPILRAAFQAGLLSETEAASALAIVDDRNLSVHTYNEKLATELASRIPGHAKLLRRWLDAMIQGA